MQSEAPRNGFWRVVKGKLRRAGLAACRPAYVHRQLARRRGECRRCGNCCRLAFRCPFLSRSNSCLIYGLVRAPNCTLFPLDERDVLDAGGACGFYFVEEALAPVGPVVRRSGLRTVTVGLCVLALVGGAAVSLALSKPSDGAAAAVRDALRAEARQQDTVLVVEDQELAALKEDPLVDAEVPVADVSAMVARLAQEGDLLIVAADEGPTALPPALRKRSVTTRVIKTAAGAFCIWRLHGQPAG